MLSMSSSIIIVIGSYSLVKCLRKKAKTAAKMAKKFKSKSKSNDSASEAPPSSSLKNKKKTQVHPL